MDFIIVVLIIAGGYFFGKRAEKKHYASILEREAKYKYIVMLTDTDVKNIHAPVHKGEMISNGVAIALDAFKNFLAKIVNIFGGRMRSYETLIDRARREAVLRLKEEAASKGYNALVNLRIETSSIGSSPNKPTAAVEALAYATGLSIDLGK